MNTSTDTQVAGGFVQDRNGLVFEVTDLVKSYRTPDGDPATILNIPAFELHRGAQMGLQGGSGSGKTTFLNILAGILPPDSGEVKLAGEPFSRLREPARDRARARHIGYIFQTFNLLQGYTALENIRIGMLLGGCVDEAYAIHLLERVGLKDRLHYRPAQLSVGQQQRIAVARALANRPAVVLADEPTGNLDRHNATSAMTLIRSVCAEASASLLLVSHDAEVLALFETVRNLSDINVAAGPGVFE